MNYNLKLTKKLKMRIGLIIVSVFGFVSSVTALHKYAKVESSLCSSLNDISLVQNTITPMPIKFPDEINWKFSAYFNRATQGPLRAKVKIVRKIVGINLPIRCFIVNGSQVGSCDFPDLCKGLLYIMNLLVIGMWMIIIGAPRFTSFGDLLGRETVTAYTFAWHQMLQFWSWINALVQGSS